MTCKLITFDVTNTLLKFSASPGVHYANVAKQYGINAEAEKLTTAFKSHWKQMNKTQPNFGARGNGYKQWWSDLVTCTFSDSGFPLNANNSKMICDHLIELYASTECWQVRSGVTETLSYLKSNHKSITLGIISNFDVRLHQILTHTGLKSYFAFVLTSYECGFCKPQVEIFRQAALIGNCLENEALHIGDDLQLDYLAAKNAGWKGILFDVDSKHQVSDSIRDIRDVVNMLENYKQNC